MQEDLWTAVDICIEVFNCVTDVGPVVEAAIEVGGAYNRYTSLRLEYEGKVRTTYYLKKGEDDQYLNNLVEGQKKQREILEYWQAPWLNLIKRRESCQKAALT